MKHRSSSWEDTTIGSVVTIKHGFAFKSEHFSDAGDHIVVTPGNFHDEGGFKPKEPEKFYVGPVDESYVLEAADVLVVMTEQKRGLLGSAGVIPVGGRYLHNQRLGRLVDLDPAVDKWFLYYLFNYRGVREQIQSTANGAKVRHTSPSRIGDVRFRLPPLGVQRKIVATLRAYDELIENNLRRIAILGEMARALYQEWFDNSRFAGHADVEREDSPSGILPSGWELRPFGDVAEFVRDNLNPASFPDEEFDHYSFEAYDSRQIPDVVCGSDLRAGKLLVETDCVLLAKLNPRIPRAWLVRVGNQRRAIASSEFVVLRPTKSISLEYLFLTVSSMGFRSRLTGLAGGTSTSHQRVKPQDLANIEVLVPTSDTIASFTKRVAPMLRLNSHLRLTNQNLHEARNLLLPRLISGDIDVSNMDIDTSWLAA